MTPQASAAAPQLNARGLVQRLAPYASRRRAAIGIVITTSLAEVILTLAQPWPLKVLIDNVLEGKPTSGVLKEVFEALPGPASQEALLWWTVAAMTLIFLLTWAATLAATVARVRLGKRLSYDIAGELFAHLQRLSLRFHARQGIGSLIRRIMD